MTSIEELKSQLTKLETKKQFKEDFQKIEQEKKDIKRKIFELKHGNKIRVAKNIFQDIKEAGRAMGQALEEAGGEMTGKKKKKIKIKCQKCGRIVEIENELNSEDKCSKCGGKFKKI